MGCVAPAEKKYSGVTTAFLVKVFLEHAVYGEILEIPNCVSEFRIVSSQLRHGTLNSSDEAHSNVTESY